MKCTVVSIESKVANNGNYYVNVTAQPADDAWADELRYRMWCSKELAERLSTNPPASIELEKVRVEVAPFQRVSDDGEISEAVCTMLSVVCRQFKGEFVDDPKVMAAKLRKQLLNEQKITEVMVDDFGGGVGDIPEE